jgi:hypothetical protein
LFSDDLLSQQNLHHPSLVLVFMKTFNVLRVLALGFLAALTASAEIAVTKISSLAQLAEQGAGEGRSIKLEPGVYRMADYLTEPVLAKIREKTPKGAGRPPVPMLELTGSNNRFDLSGVIIEIDTTLYAKLPAGYTRCIIIAGNGNTLDGLTIRNTGPNKGSGGNIFSIHGDHNSVVNLTLQVHGSFPYGYGDLLGKGGPNLVSLQKQSGVLISGNFNTLRRCKVFSRAFGHCFYIQKATNIRLEDCYAEGVTRPTTDMLRDTSGPAFDLGFKSVYENRDGRFMITPGYVKSLVEDGFRTYGGLTKVELINCTAINTRAGFEIGGSESTDDKTIIDGGVALGCERAFLLGSNVIVRRSRGNLTHGPLLYLRGGKNSDVELELAGGEVTGTVHAIATIAGANHRVSLTVPAHDANFPRVPIMLGFGMPDHAEMSSPIRPAAAENIRLINELPGVTIITSDLAKAPSIETKGLVVPDADLKKNPGPWGR